MSKGVGRNYTLNGCEMLVLRSLRLKSCPRCKGDIMLERDRWGWYEQCIQCGYLRDLENPAEEEGQNRQIERNKSSPGCVIGEHTLV